MKLQTDLEEGLVSHQVFVCRTKQDGDARISATLEPQLFQPTLPHASSPFHKSQLEPSVGASDSLVTVASTETANRASKDSSEFMEEEQRSSALTFLFDLKRQHVNVMCDSLRGEDHFNQRVNLQLTPTGRMEPDHTHDCTVTETYPTV
ncbi:putative rap1 GTPase-activating protein 1 [Scophthalmus maximus]|uniref:Putative rap1 GTPase-activating protein 1 n=1 Tax=Scophthalmus maximus TaxID=52904 RepID=A0A2U9C3Q6_SCOMX|nr:putative rap1 GTPase-activating protein 1 [Scophthalmus maximus]